MPSNFLNVLPDPNYKIDSAGFEHAEGTAGQGFSSISVVEGTRNLRNRTINGRTINIGGGMYWWEVSVKYNPLTEVQFAPIYNFLMQKRGSKKSFYLSVPQYLNPKDSDFKTWLTSNNVTVQGDTSAGVTTLDVGTWSGNTYSGLPSFGDLFTIDDPNDSLHTKAYQIARVETFDTYLSGQQPATTTIRLHFSPGLQKSVVSGAEVNFLNPLIKVIQAEDVQEYTINNDNLRVFSLKLREVFY